MPHGGTYEWRDEHGAWKTYEPEVQQQLRPGAVVTVRIGSHEYRIDPGKLTQRNVATQVERPLKVTFTRFSYTPPSLAGVRSLAERERRREAGVCSETVAFAQGLGYLNTKRVDLAAPQFGVSTAEQIKAIADNTPDLEALFLSKRPDWMDKATLATLREKCPRALCLELGCEISDEAYRDLRAQHKRHDAVLAQLLPWVSEASAEQPAESVTPQSKRSKARAEVSPPVRSPDAPSEEQTDDEDSADSSPVRRVFSDSAEGKVERLKEEMKRAIDAEDFSKLATLHQQIERVQPTESKCRVLDLTSGLFARLTDAGFAEIAALCPDVAAVFLSSDTQVPSAGLDAFREQCPGVRCLALGGEVTRETLMVLLRQYEQTKRLDLRLCDSRFSHMTAKGLDEIVALCPDLQAVFTSACCKIERQAMAELSEKHPSIRCIMLGRGISPHTYSKLETQLKEERVLDLTGADFRELSDAGIAELSRMPGLTDTLEAVFTDTSNAKMTEAAMLELRGQCGGQLKCVLLGREIGLEAHQTLLRQASENYLDFTSQAFEGVTDAGLREVFAICPKPEKLRAVFFTVQLREKAPISRHLHLQESARPNLGPHLAPAAHFVTVGDEIEMWVRTAAVAAKDALDGLQKQLRSDPAADAAVRERRDAARVAFIAAVGKLFEALAPGSAIADHIGGLSEADTATQAEPEPEPEPEGDAAPEPQIESRTEPAAWCRAQAQAQQLRKLVAECQRVIDAREPAASMKVLKALQEESNVCRRAVNARRRDHESATDRLAAAEESTTSCCASPRQAVGRRKVPAAKVALAAAKRALRDNSKETKVQVQELVSLATQHFPELLHTHEDVKTFMGSDGLQATDRQLADYGGREPLLFGRTKLIKAELDDVKVMLKEFPLQADMRGYMKEITNVQRLDHRHIIKYSAVFEDSGSMYVEMEHCSHGSLIDWVQAANPKAEQKQSVLRQVLLALVCMHEKDIVHCDIKGENILIAEDGTARICDFELSKNLGAASASTMAGGTFGFIAPEVQSRQAKPSTVSDMYSFGVLALNLLHPPAPADYPLTDASILADPALVWVAQLMHKQPAQRPTAVALQMEPYFVVDKLVEQRECDPTLKHLAYPEYWVEFPDGQDHLLVELVGRQEPELVDERERLIARIVAQRAPFTADAVVSVQRVQNKQYWQRYAAEREILRKRQHNGGNPNERGTPVADQNGPACNHLYHGAKGNVQAVLDTGPMARFSVAAEGGQGTWTCEDASYSCRRSYAPTREVFACRAVLGTPGADRTFDCHHHMQGESPVYVFWTDSAVYTEYLFRWQ